ncbi:hypothetical protein [Leminorella grimontii]|uniref:hypothetical protein n=1 Tax=Leminorella grimontii TaxID=82981 RepID=UPI0020815479|nr:hypothetical protein [Leminorella grimontii]GKX60120.1 hypothetical protein SOASR031_24350 [Leminorella grimontii]
MISEKRNPRGRKTVNQLIAEIDTFEMERLNHSVDDINHRSAVGKENCFIDSAEGAHFSLLNAESNKMSKEES